MKEIISKSDIGIIDLLKYFEEDILLLMQKVPNQNIVISLKGEILLIFIHIFFIWVDSLVLSYIV